MKKDFGVKPYLFPMSVALIATYCDDGTVDVMNMAWGTVCAENMVLLNISENHKTAENIKRRGAFTLSFADVAHVKEADFFGSVSANKMPDKFARSGLTAMKSKKVDAPVIQELPISLECKVAEMKEGIFGFYVVGEIVGTLVDVKVIDEKGEVDPEKVNAIVFDQFKRRYYALGEKVGDAWGSGKELMDKK